MGLVSEYPPGGGWTKAPVNPRMQTARKIRVMTALLSISAYAIQALYTNT
jgi:hypothetical protein